MNIFNAIKEKKQMDKINQLTEHLREVRKPLEAQLEYQNQLLNEVNKAREQYKADKDINAVLSVYEKALVYSDPPLLNANSHAKFLISLYKKAGLQDKAVQFLNSVAFDQEKYGHARLSPDKVQEELENLK